MIKRFLYAAVLAFAALLAVLQCASAAVFSGAASPASIPARIPASLGLAIYGAIDRFFPLPSIESMLVRADLNRGDVAGAALHASRMSASAARSEYAAKIALLRGDRNLAMREFLDAVDVDALRAEVERRSNAGQLREAYDLENATRARLSSTPTHPDLVAESYWRSGMLATRLHLMQSGLSDYRNALTLAPFSEKYLLAAGTQSVEMNRYKDAREYFDRCIGADPASADAVAGLGLVALHTGDRRAAQADADRSRALDPHSRMLSTLDRALQ